MSQPTTAAVQYDGQWTVSLSASDVAAQAPLASDERGVFVGNGKLGLVTGVLSAKAPAPTLMTMPLRYANGVNKANVTETYALDSMRFFDNDGKSVVQVQQQTLNTYTAILTTAYSVTDAASGNVVDVQADLYAPQHLPFCMMQTLRITPRQDTATLDLYHNVQSSTDALLPPTYNNNVVFNPAVNANAGLYMLTGDAALRMDSTTTVACATGYLFETSLAGPGYAYANLGFNVQREDPTQCYNAFRLSNLTAGITVRVHVVSSIMTSYDFEQPLEEAKRIVLSLCTTGNPGSDAAAVSATKIRRDHTAAWAKLWLTDVTIAAKAGITAQEDQELLVVKRHMRTSLYNLYSSTREHVGLEVNPLNLSALDLDGALLYSGDLWLLPVLTMLRPQAARGLLEQRYRLLATARQLAAGYGYKGAKFHYLNDTVGYKTALYWDTSGPMSLFNNALVAISVWNYYRVSLDREWLAGKGYAILKDVAEFFVSRAEYDDADGSWHLRDVVGLDGTTVSSDQNAFTNNMVRLALRYAVEASYELQYNVGMQWLAVYYGLPVPTFAPDPVLYHVLKYDADLDLTQATSQQYKLAEPLFTLLPLYSQLFFAPETSHTPQNSLKDNLDFYSARLDTSVAAPLHPFNLALKALLSGGYAQYDAAYAANFKDALNQLLSANSSGVWGHLGRAKANDITLNAVLLFTVLQGAMGLNIIGGVAETRFYYQELRLDAPPSANMPSTWKSVKASGVGCFDYQQSQQQQTRSTYITTNSLLYVG